MTAHTSDPSNRGAELARRWRATVDQTFETPSSLISYGRRDGRSVVLKVVKQRGDEWHSGEVLGAFAGRGVVRVYEHAEGAMLLERLDPGTSLAELSCNGSDDDATEVIANVIETMSPAEPPVVCPTVTDWGRAFSRYRATGDTQIPESLVRRAARIYDDLCASQGPTRLLHGDLQHYNILRDHERGWVAIDPKGVVGELEYELGASLRNPIERPDLFADGATIDRRLRTFSSRLSLDRVRITRWAFAQAVLSLVWGVEDGYAITSDNPMFRLIEVLNEASGALGRRP